MRRYFLLAGALVLIMSLIAACGDDDDNDDDTDLADDITVTIPDVEDEATEADDAAATMDEDEGTPTEADADMTGTEAEGTMDADVTGTEDDADVTMTEDDADVTGTEGMDDDGTPTEDDMATATDDDADATMDDGTATEDMAEGTATDEDAGIGVPVTVGSLILTVNDVMVLDSGGVVSPDEGNQFLGVEMTVENTSTEAIGVSRALLQTHLEDEDGDEYEIDLSATAVAIFSGGLDTATDIEPDTEITGVAGFQVPEDLSPSDLTLVIEPEDGERIEIPLDDEDTP